jgi:serine phosphatase RsbU (regulator of sigma subunit)
LLAAPDAEIKSFAPDGIPLGIQSGKVFMEETIALPEGARVLIHTDGLTEVLNSAGERYGQEPLMKWFREAAARGTSAGGLKIELTAALEKFQANMALNDDQTFLIMAG